ncbi:MAG TPA: ATP-binding protein [Gemmatimonadaceae bacterium]|jgi:signal transduction histidine kinase|nr:ATP-binding protein [Gemmatimonadaceae bacterium]
MTHIDSAIREGSNGARSRPPPTERLLLEVFDTIREPLIILDADFRVTQTNRAFVETFRVGPDDAIGQVLFELGDGQWNVTALRTLLRDRLATEAEVYDVDVDHVFPIIGRKIMRVNARLVALEADAPRIILLAIEDVTDRVFTEHRLAVQRRELERSNTALHEFAFVASHDLQEPLRKILSFGERLETSVGPLLDGMPRLYLTRILDAAGRMRTLISDLLAYSQIATSADAFTPVDLTVLARGVVSDLETAISDAGGRVEVGNLPVIEADAPQMRQLLQNLVGNALKFRRTDEAPVIRLAASAAPDGAWTITVADTGIGFKEEYREKIFRMFERLHPRAEYGGSGIGLAICRRIVERHGGTIAAASITGQGTTFSITLPATQAYAESRP